MPEADLHDILKLYARKGWTEWQEARDEEQQAAKKVLGDALVQTEGQLDATLNEFRVGPGKTSTKFLPMPRLGAKGFRRAFFAAISPEAQASPASFELLLVVSDEHRLSFRLEGSHGEKQTHDYSHLQLCRNVYGKTVKVSPDWIPDSYPAFPISSSNSLGVFLYMLVAIHGRTGGIFKLLYDLLKNGFLATYPKYEEIVKEITH
jgi:hypothetical protein